VIIELFIIPKSNLAVKVPDSQSPKVYFPLIGQILKD
jgi:hypothetical protein